MHAVPRFLWNAKMRFGKTFTTYQLAKKLGAKRVLVVTFKPAVEDAWQTDLESHVDFDGWQYLSRNSGSDPTQIDRKKPVVYFGSFQDLLGRDAAGNIKPKNEWLHDDQLGPRGLRRIPLRRVARHRQGTVRGRGGGGRQEGDQARVRRRPGRRERGPRRALGEGDRVPAHHDQGLPLPLRHAVQGAGHGRVHRGADLQLDLHRRAARQGRVRREEPRQVEPLRRAAADAPADLPDAGRAAGDRQRRGVRRVRPQRVLRGDRARATGAQFKHKSDVQKWLDIIRGAYAPKAVEQPQDRHAAAVSVFGCAPAAVSAALVLVPAQRRGLPRDGEPAGREAQHLLARLQGASSPPAPRRASGWMRCRRCARPSGAASRPRPSRSRAASSPPASPCRSGRRS